MKEAKTTITRAEIRRIAREVYEECEENKRLEENRQRLQDAINGAKASKEVFEWARRHGGV